MRQRSAGGVARVGVVLASAALVFAACGGGASPSPTGGGASPGESAAASGGQIGGTVTVIGTWTDAEQESFLAMVKPFEDATGVKVNYTGTRDLNAVLTTGVQSGVLPDVAGLPGPGQMVEWAKVSALKPLDDVIDLNAYKADSPPGYVDVGNVDGKQYGVFIKGSIKGLIWYDPKVYSGGVPTSWDDLNSKAQTALGGLSGAKEWCVGLESGAASGWPGTDWIEDFVLRQAGPDVFDQWTKGTLKWTSPEIKAAFQSFGEVINNSYGGPDTVLTTAFQKGGNPLFTSPPGCLFHHQASFITDFFKNEGGAKDGDFDFFPFPDINTQFAGAVEGGGDLFGVFNDTPQAKALIQYLITPAAQEIWVKRGGAISGSKSVPIADYPDDVSKRSAELLAGAKIFRFDGSDLMPNAMNTAFWSAILDFTKDQSKLDAILANLDTVQTSAYGG